MMRPFLGFVGLAAVAMEALTVLGICVRRAGTGLQVIVPAF
jgi:hypothetical protein